MWCWYITSWHSRLVVGVMVFYSHPLPYNTFKISKAVRMSLILFTMIFHSDFAYEERNKPNWTWIPVAFPSCFESSKPSWFLIKHLLGWNKGKDNYTSMISFRIIPQVCFKHVDMTSHFYVHSRHYVFAVANPLEDKLINCYHLPQYH